MAVVGNIAVIGESATNLDKRCKKRKSKHRMAKNAAERETI